jgi:FXSXX-COOH protein
MVLTSGRFKPSIARNVCVGKWLEAGWHATPEMLRMENNLTNASLAAAPGDQARAKDFGLKKDSPAWGLGFTAIPLAEIGLRDTDLRRALTRLSGANGPPR